MRRWRLKGLCFTLPTFDYTVEEALLIMRNLKCKVYDDELIVQELAKQQKEVVEKLDIIVPKRLGI